MATSTGEKIIIAFLIFIVLLAIAFAIYWFAFRSETGKQFVPVNHTPQNVGRTGIWNKDTGVNYATGVDYKGAQEYCQKENGKLATKAQLMDAYNQGFGLCKYGWLDGQEAGYVMTTVDNQCGNTKKGYTPAPNQDDASTKYSAYCYGTIPQNGQVDKSFVLGDGGLMPISTPAG